jgi:hypothetical protein
MSNGVEPVTPDETLPRVCSWCGRHLAGPEPHPNRRVSHGICPECFREAMRGSEVTDGEEGQP